MVNLKVFVAGMTPAARRAVTNLENLCETSSLEGDYSIEVVDILEDPGRAEDEKILVTPTVVRVQPEPVLRVIGDLSDREQALAGLELTEA